MCVMVGIVGLKCQCQCWNSERVCIVVRTALERYVIFSEMQLSVFYNAVPISGTVETVQYGLWYVRERGVFPYAVRYLPSFFGMCVVLIAVVNGHSHDSTLYSLRL